MKDIMLLNEDCLKTMDKMIEEGVKFDAIITDPPYGTVNGLTLDGWSNARTDWDVAIDTEIIFDKYMKLLRKNGKLIMFCQEPFTSKTIFKNPNKTNLKFLYKLFWIKNHFANALLAKQAPVNYLEEILVFGQKNDIGYSNPMRSYSKKIIDYIKAVTSTTISDETIKLIITSRKSFKNFFSNETLKFAFPTKADYENVTKDFNLRDMGGYLEYNELIKYKEKVIFNLNGETKKSNLLYFKKDVDGRHPTQKPIKLMENLISTYTNEGDLIFDPFMGSGSTGVAAKNLGRRFVGTERNKEYFQVAQERIKNSSSVKSIFDLFNKF